MSSTGRLDRFALMTNGAGDAPGVRAISTHDHDLIMRWAQMRGAQPATGEETVSGPAVRRVNDTGAGIRFNFPGFAPYRPITWAEWFENFDKHQLSFVYEEENREQVSDVAHARWHARGETDGDDWADWFEAERDLQLRQVNGAMPNVRYRFIKR